MIFISFLAARRRTERESGGVYNNCYNEIGHCKSFVFNLPFFVFPGFWEGCQLSVVSCR